MSGMEYIVKEIQENYHSVWQQQKTKQKQQILFDEVKMSSLRI